MIFVILYQIFVVWLSYKNYYLISSGKKVKHWLNGMIHVLVSLMIGWGYGWQYCISNLILTRVVFDTSLNIFRHLSLGYVSPLPASWLDKQEKKFIFWIAGIVYKKRTIISENKIERLAIYFRLVLLICGVLLLIL